MSRNFLNDIKRLNKNSEKGKIFQGGSKKTALKKFELACYYKDKLDGDRLNNLQKAIELFIEAKEIYDVKNLTLEKAIVNVNLGSAYCDFHELYAGSNLVKKTYSNEFDIISELEIKGYLIKAISCFKSALKILEFRKNPLEWAVCYLNLGTAYRAENNITDHDFKNDEKIKKIRKEKLEQSIDCFKSAMIILNANEYPQYYTIAEMNLGNSYADFFNITNNNYYFDLAVYCYNKALKIAKQYYDIESIANIENNLGDLYKDKKNFEESIKILQKAANIFNEQNNFLRCLTANRNLGNTAYQAELWNIAIEGYEKAINIIEKLRSFSKSDERRQKIIGFDLDIYEKLITAYLKTKEFNKAFETVERCRSRYLVDLMTSYNFSKNQNISNSLKQKIEQYENLQKQINNLFLNDNPHEAIIETSSIISEEANRAAISANSELISQLESKKQEIWQEIRELDPILSEEIQVSYTNIEKIQELINNNGTAIISFYTGENKIYIFILSKNLINYYICEEQGALLQNSIFVEWLGLYIQEKEKWVQQLPNLLNKIGGKLQIKKLVENYLEGIEELIIIPHIYLHLIPFSAIPINEKETLGDRFLIRYAPSCQILEFCANRPELGDNLTYGTVENATEDLPCASFEGEQIAQLYQIPKHFRLQGSQQATVKNYRQLMEQVQVLHSSHHAQSRLDNPLESSLKLADGYITLGQLLSPGWRMPNLSDVFLSCCETGLGVTEITDDILTLATGFLCAGARSVISTLWSVDDVATSIFSIIYHQNRKQGLNRPQSLQQAQIQLRTMTGETLAKTYKPLLEPMLSEKLKYSTTKRKELDKERSQFSNDSVERKNLDSEHDKWNIICRRTSDTKKLLQNFCTQEYPFENPYYWAAFVCHGLS